MTRITMRDSLDAMPDPARAAIVGKAGKVANNTFKFTRQDGAEIIRLHTTDIITKRQDGKTMLDSGGWQTVTTKDRFNHFSDYQVYSEKGVWFVHGDGDKKAEYYDGIVLPDAFKTKAKPNVGKAKLAKEINKFVKLIDTVETLPAPNDGDCWSCLFFEANEPGAMVNTTDHLESHIKEGYLHGALIVNAMQWAGHSREGAALHYQMNLRDTLKRTLRRYLRRQLGLLG